MESLKMDTKPLLAYSIWLSLPNEMRAKLKKLFDIPRSGEVIVRSGQITPQGNIGSETTQDGHSPKDLYAISIEKMQELLGTSENDFYSLFDQVVEKIDELPISAPPPAPAPTTLTPDILVPSHRGRKKGSKNKKRDGKTK